MMKKTGTVLTLLLCLIFAALFVSQPAYAGGG